MDYSQPGSSAHGDSFPRQEYWSGLPSLSLVAQLVISDVVVVQLLSRV